VYCKIPVTVQYITGKAAGKWPKAHKNCDLC
jgi:hypothetical protein